jgi:hypothetical protein
LSSMWLFRLCVAPSVLCKLYICFSFFVAKIRYAFCCFWSSSLMAFSFSGMRLSQYFFRGFSVLCCSSSFVKTMFVRLIVCRIYVVDGCGCGLPLRPFLSSGCRFFC